MCVQICTCVMCACQSASVHLCARYTVCVCGCRPSPRLHGVFPTCVNTLHMDNLLMFAVCVNRWICTILIRFSRYCLDFVCESSYSDTSARCASTWFLQALLCFQSSNKARSFCHIYLLYTDNWKHSKGQRASDRQANGTLDLEVHSVHWHVKK